MPSLANFVDMTGSRNPDRIFQMVCRLVRRPTRGEIAKRFVKVMPPAFAGVDLEYFMTGVMMLGDRDVYTSWQGVSPNRLVVGVREQRLERDGRTTRKPLLARGMMNFGNVFAAMTGVGFARATLGELLGRFTKNPSEKKDRVRAFHERYGRLPSPSTEDEEERRLESQMSTYCKINGPMFDPDFRRWCMERGLRTHRDPSEKRATCAICGESFKNFAPPAYRDRKTCSKECAYKASNRRFEITIEGVSKTLAQWSRETGLAPATIAKRCRAGVASSILVSRRDAGKKRRAQAKRGGGQ